MAGYEVPTPKYLRVLNSLRERIEDGSYPPGAALPSENQLATEYDVSRPTVLKALGILRQDGWIESQQGKGHFVRGRPPLGRAWPEHARDALDLDETHVELLHVGPVLASARIADVLGIPEGTPVYERRRRTLGADDAPVDLVATFVPVEIAVGTDITKSDPIPEGLLEHIKGRKGIRGDYAHEWLTARPATRDEAKLLDIKAGEPVLAVVFAVHQAAGDAVLAATAVLPGVRHEIEDTYPIN